MVENYIELHRIWGDAICQNCGTFPCICQLLKDKGWVKLGSNEFAEAASEYCRNEGWMEPN